MTPPYSGADPTLPPEMQPAVAEMQRALDAACARIARPMRELLLLSNAARVAAASDPSVVALGKIETATKKFRSIAEQR
jgi:hypothetical protein